jgi:hypothetical protein
MFCQNLQLGCQTGVHIEFERNDNLSFWHLANTKFTVP